MTSEIVRMINQYTRTAIKEDIEFEKMVETVNDNSRKTDPVEFEESNIETWGSLIKDPVSKSWMTRDEYQNNVSSV
jgi:hypothetical protein